MVKGSYMELTVLLDYGIPLDTEFKKIYKHLETTSS